MRYILIALLFVACARKPPVVPSPAILAVPPPAVSPKDAPGAQPDEVLMMFEPEPVYFAFDSYEIREDQLGAATVIAWNWKPGCRLEGHACPFGEGSYNFALGSHRAGAVKNYLQAYGVTGEIPMVSYGEERPVTTEPSKYHLNRRVTFECPE